MVYSQASLGDGTQACQLLIHKTSDRNIAVDLAVILHANCAAGVRDIDVFSFHGDDYLVRDEEQ